MGDWDPSIKLTENDIRQFNQYLLANASPLIQEAAKKASENIEGPVFLTPPQLPRFVDSKDQYYEAYRDYAEAFDRLLKSANTPIKLKEDLNPDPVNQVSRKYFYELSQKRGTILLFTCYERKSGRTDIYEQITYRELKLGYITCPDGDPNSSEVSKIRLLHTIIEALRKELARIKKIIEQIEALQKEGVYSELQKKQFAKQEIEKKFGDSSEWDKYLVDQYGVVDVLSWPRDYLDLLSAFSIRPLRGNKTKFEQDKLFLQSRTLTIATAEIAISEKILNLQEGNRALFSNINDKVFPSYSILGGRRLITLIPSNVREAEEAIQYLKIQKQRMEKEISVRKKELERLLGSR